MNTREREDENICRQCSLNKEDDCMCRCVECGENTWPSGKCSDCEERRELNCDSDAAAREDMDDERREWDREVGQ